MTDYTELRRLAERYEDTVDDIDAHLEAVQDYRDATRPSTVLALLDEVERCHKRLHSPYAADARAEADTYAEAVVKAIARAEKAEATIATQAKEIERLTAESGRLEAALTTGVQAIEDYLAGADNRLAEAIRPYADGAEPLLSRRTRKAEARVKELEAAIEPCEYCLDRLGEVDND